MQTPESRQLVVERIKESVLEGYHVIAVVSAMGRFGDPYATDTLIGLHEWTQDSKELHLIKSCGELISAAVLTSLVKANKIDCQLLYGQDAGLIYNKDHIMFAMDACQESVKEYPVTIVPGFQAVTVDHNFYCFERGGSDYSALYYAHHFKCEAIFYKDVPGVYYPPDSLELADQLTHAQLCELEILQKRAAQYAALHQIPIRIGSYLSPSHFTVIQSLPLPPV